MYRQGIDNNVGRFRCQSRPYSPRPTPVGKALSFADRLWDGPKLGRFQSRLDLGAMRPLPPGFAFDLGDECLRRGS